MSKISDPARDFTDLCLRLRSGPGDKQGAQTLATRFEVEPWSTDFMLILASIHQRIEALRIMISKTELDDDIKGAAFGCLGQIRTAFSENGLQNQWQHSITNFLSDTYLTPIRMTSGYVRVHNGYQVPDDDELADMVSEIETLRGWLIEIDLVEKDFIRGALIEGLDAFLFRVKRVGYYGWPDSFEALKAVVAAYMALERGAPDPNVSPPYEATLKKVGEFLSKTFDRVKSTKEVTEVGDWLLRGYVALQAVGHVQPAVAGLLTHAVG